MRRLLMLAGLFLSVPCIAKAPVTQRHVRVADDIHLHVVEAGSGDRAPLVFVPGWSTDAGIWERQITTFATSRRVIAIDPRSQGQSTKTTTGNTPERRAEDLHAALAALAVRRPVLIGWSQAVQDIAAYVLRYGTEELAGIVLVDAAVSDGAPGIAKRPEQVAAQFGRFPLYLDDQRAYLRGMMSFIISKPQPPGAIDALVATGMKTPPSIGLSMLIADMFGTDRTPALARMACPVLIIAAGTSTELERQQAEVKGIPGARFVRIDDAAHTVFLDQPDKFDAALDRFLQDIPPPMR